MVRTALGELKRLSDAPIVSARRGRPVGANVSGPSLVAVRDQGSGGALSYRLYFAHHRGHSIRLATSGALDGPWLVEAPVLHLRATPYTDHIASPVVLCDSDSSIWRLYFHGGNGTGLCGQSEAVALSRDGRSFQVHGVDLGRPYWSVFETGGHWYALVMPGTLWESGSGLSDFEPGPMLLPATARHSSVVVVDDLALMFYSRIGDSPEHIRLSVVGVSGPWRFWRSVDVGPVLMPEAEFEGVQVSVRPSRPGECHEPSREIRDPAALIVGKWLYLAYAAGGERALGLARGSVDHLVDIGRAALREAYG